MLYALYAEYFPGAAPSLELMLGWVRRWPKALAMVHRGNDEGDLVGSFKLLALTTHANAEIEALRLTGSTIGAEYLVPRQSEAAGYYIGDLVGTTYRTRGVVLGYLASALAEVPSNLPIYARPLSGEGLRVMAKYGFRKIGEEQGPAERGHMCILRGDSRPSRFGDVERLQRLAP